MVPLKQDQTSKLDAILEKAVEFHGHLGPFLVLGVRMSLIGLRELGVKGDYQRLRVTATLRNRTPFSCILDGIQVVTKCTMGNKRLRLKNDTSQIVTKFQIGNDRREVNVMVSPATFENLKIKLLGKDTSPEEIKKLAETVATMPEEKLFTIRSR